MHVHVGDVDSLDLCEDSNLDSRGEESSSDMQFTYASSSDAVSELNDSLCVPTPERRLKIKLKRVESRKVALAEHEKFMSVVNSVRGCKTPNCTGKLIPVELKSVGLGGSLSITYVCDGCQLQSAMFTTSSVSQQPVCSGCIYFQLYTCYLLQNLETLTWY